MRHSAFKLSRRPTYTTHGTPKELAVLKLLEEYDCLPSHYIFYKLGGRHYLEDILPMLVKGHYIALTPEAEKREGARAKKYIYHLLPRGKQLLKDQRASSGRHGAPLTSRHQYLASISKFSFDLADEVGLTLHTQADIVSHEKCPPIEGNPCHIPLGEKLTVIPDAPLFGYDYQGQSYMFFHGFEIDRGTEPLETHEYSRVSIQEKFRNYRTYLEEHGYLHRYGLSSITLLFITTKPKRMEGMMRLWAKECLEYLDFALFKTIPDIDEACPDPSPYMIAEDWHEVRGIIPSQKKGKPPELMRGTFNVLDTLKATARTKATLAA